MRRRHVRDRRVSLRPLGRTEAGLLGVVANYPHVCACWVAGLDDGERDPCVPLRCAMVGGVCDGWVLLVDRADLTSGLSEDAVDAVAVVAGWVSEPGGSQCAAAARFQRFYQPQQREEMQ